MTPEFWEIVWWVKVLLGAAGVFILLALALLGSIFLYWVHETFFVPPEVKEWTPTLPEDSPKS
jgi:hypothetical protein